MMLTTLAHSVWIALAIIMGVATIATEEQTAITPTTDSTDIPMFITNVSKLVRSTRNELLVEVPCIEEYCKNVRFQIKVAGASKWNKNTAYSPQSNSVRNKFNVMFLSVNTSYVLRPVYIRPGIWQIYVKDDLPILEARTCPDIPPPVSDLHAYSAGPGWLEVRWTPPKETCKSHLSYEARYRVSGGDYKAWRRYGYYYTNHSFHFHPTHPCAVWPNEFCLLLTEDVEAGMLHFVEVRVRRFNEMGFVVSAARKVVVRADTGCVANDTCDVICGAPVTTTTTKAPTDEVDVDDSDIAITTLSSNASLTFDGITRSPLHVASTQSEESEQQAAEQCTQKTSSQSGSDSLLGRLGGVFLALLLVTCVALPIAYLYGKRRGAREAVELHMVHAWRPCLGGDGGSTPVLVEGVEKDGGCENAGATIRVDQHGRFSWVKLLPSDDD